MDENADGAVVTSVATENATSVTVDNDHFEVADGNLKLKAGRALDFESDTSPIEVVITASGDGESDTHTVTISVNNVNEAPAIEVAGGAEGEEDGAATAAGITASFSVAENSGDAVEGAAGAILGLITLSDPDAGDTHTVAVGGDQAGKFQVIDHMGAKWLTLKSGESLDFEEAAEVKLTLTVTDAGGLSAGAPVTITVNDVNEAPSAPVVRDAALSVDENDAGATLSSLSDSTDPEGAAVSYSVDNEKFEITSGLVLKLKDGESLNYEDGAAVDLVITASDPDGNTSETPVTVTVGNVNEKPEVTVGALAVDENMPGAAAGAITPSDPEGGELTVEVSGDERFEARQDEEGGWWVALKDGRSLDHETDESIDLMVTVTEVTVTDADGLTATADATVAVNDVNEKPELTVGAPSAVAENEPSAFVATVSATDPDDGATLEYMVSGDERFEVADGMLKLKAGQSLDYEQESDRSIALTVTVSDGTLSDSKDVTVMAGNANEAVSIAVEEGAVGNITASFSVDENSGDAVPGTAGAILGIVKLEDADGGALAASAVQITDDQADKFQVIDHAGATWLTLKLGESLNYEEENADGNPTIALTLIVTDGGTPPTTGTAEVTITVNDVNEAPEVNAEEAKKVSDAPATFVSGKEGGIKVDLKALFSDPDGDGITYSLEDKPEWLKLSVTTEGSGDDLTIKGTVSGTPPDDAAEEPFKVSIVASNRPSGGLSAEASFDVVVDKENAKPDEVYLRRPAADGESDRVSEVPVKENAPGFVLGRLYVTDEDNDRHPHGQHEFSFSDDRFEEDDGMLKLKEGKFLDFEEDGAELVLEVTAMDNKGGKDRLSVSTEITIKVGDLKAAEGEGPVANPKIGDWWVTADNNLRSEDVGAGDWLSFRLQTAGSEAAFTDADGDSSKLEYTAIRMTDADGKDVDWLQIDRTSGKITNKAKTEPERGVYTVTVTARDEDNNEAQASFELAVALSDVTAGVDGRRGNDGPRISVLRNFDYTEGSLDEVVVASFSVDDRDIAIDPHPYGLLHVDFEAKQGTKSVKDSLKLVEVSRDGTAVNYEIRAKSAEDRAKGADGPDKDSDPDVYPKGHKDEGKVKPVDPLDFENGDRVEITVWAWDNLRYQEVDGKLESKPYVFNKAGDFELLDDDGGNAADERVTTFDIVDADDDAPMFVPTGVYKTRTMTLKAADRDPKTATTTIEVDQESRTVIVVPLEDAWEDEDTADRDLVFGSDDEAIKDLGWINVYGPDQWSDIQARSKRVGEEVVDGDRPTGIGARDQVVVIVVDREAGEGANELPGGKLPSFTLTASDGAKRTTETISIKVVDTNVDIADADKDKVVMIDPKGDPNGTGSLEMKVDLSLDPDLDGPGDALLAVYTWSHDGGTDSGPDNIISVSSTPQPLDLDADDDGVNDYSAGQTVNGVTIASARGAKIKASVQYYEVDPKTGAIVESLVYDSEETAAVDPADTDPELSVSYDVNTTTTGVSVTIRATGDARDAGGRALLQSSPTGEGNSWTTVSTANADTSSGSATVPLTIPANDGRSAGDGGGLHYQVVYQYPANGQTIKAKPYDLEQLGDLTAGDPTTANGSANIIGTFSSVTPGTPQALLVVDTEGNEPDVQWQIDPDGPEGWRDIDGADRDTLTVTGDQVGGRVRAKVTYKADDIAATAVDESQWADWIEYTEVISVARAANIDPVVRDANYELRVVAKEPTAKEPIETNKFDASKLFFDADDGKDLTYTITTVVPNLTNRATSATSGGTVAELGSGGQVFRVYADGWDSGSPARTEDVQQAFWIDSDTGMVTYFTDEKQGHDGDGADGAGNTLTFTIQAADEGTSPAAATVVVRINVAPTAIEFTGGGTITNTAGNLEDDDMATPTALTVSGGDYSVAENVKNQPFVPLGTINVQDENGSTIGTNADNFGRHDIKFSDDRFEFIRNATDNSSGQIRLKQGAAFDYEKDGKAIAGVTDQKLLTVKVTATDGGGLDTEGYFSIRITDVAEDPAPPKTTTPTETKNPESTEGLRDDERDENRDQDGDSEDGPAIEPPKDGGAFIDEDDLIGLAIDDDLLGDFVLAIDDGIDIA